MSRLFLRRIGLLFQILPFFNFLIHDKLTNSNFLVFASIHSRSTGAPNINYGGRHPFEQALANGPNRNLQTTVSYEPIRIVYDLSDIERQNLTATDEGLRNKIKALLDKILPDAAMVWHKTLMLVPVVGNLFIGSDVEEAKRIGRFSNCPILMEQNPPHNHSVIGVSDADIVLYVALGGVNCLSKSSSVFSTGIPCELDQFDRPIAGTLSFCLDIIELNRFNQLSESEISFRTNLVVHEIAHVLGMNTELLKFFRDPETGDPLTPRPFDVSSDLRCLDGKIRNIIKPGCNTLRLNRSDPGGVKYFEVVTPTVSQVVRNQFDCQILAGAPLENQPGASNDCFGSNWEQRLFFLEAMSSSAHGTEFFLSPLTLALMEDSGWYKANYTSEFVKINPFGHGAGCDFVTKKCLIDNGFTVPSYSKGYFCNKELSYTTLGTLVGQYKCDASHGSKSPCDLVNYDTEFFSQFHEPPSSPFQYFEDSKWGSFHFHADYCPTFSVQQQAIRCDNEDERPLFVSSSEFYGEGSRCFNLLGEMEESLCLASSCNEADKVLEVYVGDMKYVCDHDEQTHELPLNEGLIECPRLKSVCPQFFCPANCAGRGVCNFGDGNPKCLCFDPKDTTDGCYNSPALRPILDTTKCGDETSSAVYLFGGKNTYFVVFICILLPLLIEPM